MLADGEQTDATINAELMVRREGTRDVRREVKIYNLDMVLAVGYRVTTTRAVQFRQWATTVLREYLVVQKTTPTRPLMVRARCGAGVPRQRRMVSRKLLGKASR